jgi:hypothetical protein
MINYMPCYEDGQFKWDINGTGDNLEIGLVKGSKYFPITAKEAQKIKSKKTFILLI